MESIYAPMQKMGSTEIWDAYAGLVAKAPSSTEDKYLVLAKLETGVAFLYLCYNCPSP